MPKANSKLALPAPRLALFLFAILALLPAGCSDPEIERIEDIGAAEALRQTGQYEAALEILEALSAKFPNDPEILRAMAEVYAARGDAPTAAFFYAAAQRLQPEDGELLYAAYLAQEAAREEAAAKELLELLAVRRASALNPNLWSRLGELRRASGEDASALEAYLRSVELNGGDAEPATALAIGTLFLESGNTAQAERWLRPLASDEGDVNALPALFGMLEIEISRQNWPAAEQIMARLDQQFPGAVEASRWLEARAELEAWREAQEALAAELNRGETAAGRPGAGDEDGPSPTSEEFTGEAAGEAIAAAEADTGAEDAATGSTVDGAEPRTGKTSGLEGISEIEDFADRPALEDTEVAEDAPPATASVESPPDIETLMERADRATVERDYASAITAYWQALGIDNERAEIWNLLSRAYLLTGEVQSAETTALEATRLAPQQIQFALDYLRIAQQSKSADDFLAELEAAYDRFPRSPEIALSLARGYERIAADADAALTLYQRFIALSPDHPLRPEAEAAVARLR